MDHILNHDVNSNIMDFLLDEYIFVGSVNRKCRAYFKKRNHTVTNVSSCFESLSKLKWSGILEETDIKKEPYVYNSKSTEVLEYCLEKKIVPSINGALACAIRRQDKDMIDYMEDRFEMHGPACMIAAVESGSLDMVKRYCIDNMLDYRAHNFFPDGAHLYNLNDRDRIVVCSNWRTYVGDYLVEAAKDNGQFEILKWLHSQGIPDPTEEPGVVGTAALKCSNVMIKWMLNQGYTMNMEERHTDTGIRQGDYIRWMRDMGSH